MHPSAADAAGAASAADRILRRAPRLLLLGTIVVLLLDVAFRSLDRSFDVDAARWFDVGREHNVPTAWSVLLLATGAVAAARVARRNNGAGHVGWYGAAVVALYLAADEWFGWHEHLKGVGERLADAGVGLATYAWVIPGAMLALAGAVAAFTWSRGLVAVVRRRVRLAVVVYGTGVLGVESVSGSIHAERGWLRWTVLTAVEEGLEMAGALLLVTAAAMLLRVSEPTRGLEIEVGVGDMGGELVGRGLGHDDAAPAQRRRHPAALRVRRLGRRGGIDVHGVPTALPQLGDRRIGDGGDEHRVPMQERRECREQPLVHDGGVQGGEQDDE
jgi:hypothetical protein